MLAHRGRHPERRRPDDRRCLRPRRHDGRRKAVGKIGEEEILIGEQSESYQVQPGTVHEVKIEMKIDHAHAGKVFDTIELRTWQGGTAAGHGVIITNGDTSSFISVPSLVTS